MILTNNNDHNQINAALLSANRETDFKVADYKSIIDKNNSDLDLVNNTLYDMSYSLEKTIVDVADEVSTEWQQSLNVPQIGSGLTYIESVKQDSGRISAVAKEIVANNFKTETYTTTGTTTVDYMGVISIPAGARFGINLFIEEVTNDSDLQSITITLNPDSSTEKFFTTLKGSLYEHMHLFGITQMFVPINGFSFTQDIGRIRIAFNMGANTTVKYHFEGYYQKPLG